MIISVSRRTDVPAYYSEWFYKRLQEGFVLVRNPMNYSQVSKVKLTQDVVDCFVFWTKNPAPMIKNLDFLKAYDYYFTYTLNPYGKPVENNLPPLEDRLKTFKTLAATIGSEKLVWRYDPIILTETYNQAYHLTKFKEIASSLEGSTDTCVFSFMRPYPKIKKRIAGLGFRQIQEEDMQTLVGELAAIGQSYGINLESCSEETDFQKLGVGQSKCIDDRRIGQIIGQKISVDKDKNQREVCGCVKSIDIGAYNTCHHDCLYCYANFSQNSVKNNSQRHKPESPLMIGDLEVGDQVKDREMTLYKGPDQLSFF